MKSLISQLKKHSLYNFPVKDVSSTILNSEIQENIIKKYSHFSKSMYTRNRIFRNDDFEIILLCWLPNQMAPIHGHEGEKCWFKVINGNLKISNYSIKSLAPLKLSLEEKITASEGYLDGPADIHSIENCSNKPVITLHIYANPYDTCTVYNLKEKQIDKLKMNYHSIDGKLC
ncbi:cysteine dioxygenase family protein [bacterium]|jgi:cysteine dioxygenase|nr:cysteine dioxygenase family protein [bacterium]MBT4928064.1 cysteine dioxygenase family protein [bacterium]MBT5734720.1 cysteine dioxygenase family protein [bacterium]MBT6019141.1 cysteine dioxygenase family protein [bacterium]